MAVMWFVLVYVFVAFNLIFPMNYCSCRRVSISRTLTDCVPLLDCCYRCLIYYVYTCTYSYSHVKINDFIFFENRWSDRRHKIKSKILMAFQFNNLMPTKPGHLLNSPMYWINILINFENTTKYLSFNRLCLFWFANACVNYKQFHIDKLRNTDCVALYPRQQNPYCQYKGKTIELMHEFVLYAQHLDSMREKDRVTVNIFRKLIHSHPHQQTHTHTNNIQ